MSDLGLTAPEKKIFDLLTEKPEVSIEDIMERVKGGTRHSLSVRMKYLSAKIAPKGWIIENTGGVGRGNKASYKLTKKF